MKGEYDVRTTHAREGAKTAGPEIIADRQVYKSPQRIQSDSANVGSTAAQLRCLQTMMDHSKPPMQLKRLSERMASSPDGARLRQYHTVMAPLSAAPIAQLMTADQASALDSFDYGTCNLVDIGTNPHRTADGNDLWKYIWKHDDGGADLEVHWHGGSVDASRINIRWPGEGNGSGRQIPNTLLSILAANARRLGWV